MQRVIQNSVLVFCFLCSPAVCFSLTVPEVTAIRHTATSTGLRVRILTTGPVKNTIKKFVDPDRVVVDLSPAVLKFPQKSVDISKGWVQRIRCAQFQVKPFIVRVVVDLERDLHYTVSQSEDKKELYLDFAHQVYNISYNENEDSSLVVVRVAGKPVHHAYFEKNPPQIVLDLYGAMLATSSDVKIKNSKRFAKISASQISSMSETVRVVVELKENSGYTVSPVGIGDGFEIRVFPPGDSISLTGFKICVDAGHGGKAKGAISPGGLVEKDLNLDVASELARLLAEAGAEVFFSRFEDEDLSLEDRVYLAEEVGADFFVSIHHNANKNQKIRGSEVYYVSEHGLEFAKEVLKNLTEGTGLPPSGVKTANFFVIKYTTMPAILVEVAYLTNPQDEQLLANLDFRKKVARSVFHGVRTYLSKQQPLTASHR